MDVIPEHLSSTPSSASQIKPQSVENAFPTPPFDTPARLASRNKAPPSPAPAKLLNFPRAASTPPETTNDKRFRSLSSALSEDSAGDHSWQRLQLARKKSQYYTDAFAYREPYHNAKDRVARDSVVTAEVKLNCCVRTSQPHLRTLANVQGRKRTRISHRSLVPALRYLQTTCHLHHGHGQYRSRHASRWYR